MPHTADLESVRDLESKRLGADGAPPPPRDHGDGDDWNHEPFGRRGPHSRLQRYRIGLFFAVVSIYTLFIAITSAYIVRHTGGRFDPYTGTTTRDWQSIDIPAILWLNTLLLVASSFTLERARTRVFREAEVMSEWLGIDQSTRHASLPWLGVSILLGFGFLTGQFLAWDALNMQGIYVSTNPASAFFFLLTAAHALHLFGGIIALVWSLAAGGLMSLQSRQIAIDISTWYWHAMGLLWIYVFGLLHWLR